MLLEHSAFILHSGRQFGGLPLYSGKHMHEGEPPISLHCEFGPHGDGMHGLVIIGRIGTGSGAMNEMQNW